MVKSVPGIELAGTLMNTTSAFFPSIVLTAFRAGAMRRLLDSSA